MGMSYCRYYGRRKAQEDSDSELSGLEDDKADIGGGARAQLRWLSRKMRPNQYLFVSRPDQGNANGGNGKMWSSRAKVSKTPHPHGASLPIPSFLICFLE